MPEFNFFVNRKITEWYRDRYKIEAIDQDQAVDFMTKLIKGELPVEYRAYPDSSDPIDDTMENLSPEDNGGAATLELSLDIENGHDVPICDNAIPPIQNPHV